MTEKSGMSFSVKEGSELTVSRDNVYDRLRAQYVRRRPRRNPFGTEDAPVQWAQLGLGMKIGILWQLCEWQMEDPARFRGLLKSEEDAASWVRPSSTSLTTANRPCRMGQGRQYLFSV